jgi:hypothetical protein
MNYLIKGSLFAAVFLASVFSQAAIFGTYNDEGNLFRSHLNNHLSEDLVAKFKDKVDSKDGVLYLLEQARLLQVNHQYEESLNHYKQAFRCNISARFISRKSNIDNATWSRNI